MSRASFSDEFKRDAVAQITARSCSIGPQATGRRFTSRFESSLLPFRRKDRASGKFLVSKPSRKSFQPSQSPTITSATTVL